MSLPRIPGVNSESAATELLRTPERLAGNAQSAAHRLVAGLDGDPETDDWGLSPTPERPHPVVLVHGTLGDRESVWRKLAPALRTAGHRIFRLNYGELPTLPRLYGLGDMRKSSQELADFVDRVLVDTKASKVDLVGHSQGGMLPHYYLKYLGGAGKVRRVVGIAPSNHGVEVAGLTKLVRQIPGVQAVVEDKVLFRISPAFTQLLHDSEFVGELVAPGDTVDGVDYTVIWSTRDELVQPPEAQQLKPARPEHPVTNTCLQLLVPQNRTTHLAMPYDPIVVRETLKALAD